VSNSELKLSLWEHGIDGIREPFEAINTNNENILNASILKLGEHV